MSRSVHEMVTELLVFSSPKHPSVPVFSTLPMCKGLLYPEVPRSALRKDRLVKLKHQKTSNLKGSQFLLVPNTFLGHLDLVAMSMFWHWGLLASMFSWFLLYLYKHQETIQLQSIPVLVRLLSCSAAQTSHKFLLIIHGWMEKSKDTEIPCHLLPPWG